MITLKHIDVFSAAKIAAIIYLVMGIIGGVLIFLLVSVFSSPLSSTGAFSILIIPITALVIGFVVVAIEAWLYNVIADRIGGIKIALTRGRLKAIDPLSAAKVYGVGGAIIGFVIGIILTVSGLVIGSASVFRLASIVILPVLLGIVFFVGAIICAAAYNFIALKIGGIILKFKKGELVRIGAISYAKIESIGGAIAGLIDGVVYAVIGASTKSIAAVPSLAHTLGAFSIVVYPIIYFAAGFVAALVIAWLYNVIVPKFGGIMLTLK